MINNFINITITFLSFLLLFFLLFILYLIFFNFIYLFIYFNLDLYFHLFYLFFPFLRGHGGFAAEGSVGWPNISKYVNNFLSTNLQL